MKAMLLVFAFAVQQPDTIELKPVVVTATRAAVRADLVSSAVTVLRGPDLVSQGIRTVAQALGQVPGAHVVETGSFGGQTSLFTRGGESDYTKVLVDGVPMNQAGGAIDLAHLTTDNVDRIEIVRGPTSVLYGSDAMTGVVQIFTRAGAGAGSREQGAEQLGIELRGGTYGTAEGALSVAGRTGALDYSLRWSRFSSDGLYPYNNRYRNSMISARLVWRPDERSDATFSYRYGDDIYHIPTNGQGAPVDSNQRAAERGPLFSLSAGRLVGEHLEVRLNASLREARMFYNDEPDSPGEDGTFWSRDWVRRSTTSALITWRDGDRLSVIGGVEYEDQRQRGRSEFSASYGTFPNPPLDTNRTNTGYFTQLLLSRGRSAVTLGGRLDDNSQFGAHSTYRAGLVYRLSDGARLRFSLGTGFKEPSFFENYATGFVRGNPNLEAERSRSWEVGVDRGQVAVTYFNQRFHNLIEYSDTLLLPDSVNYFNVGGALANGIEASIRTSVTPRLEFSMQYTYLHTRVTASGSSSDPDGLFVPGKPLIRRPAHALAPQLAATLGQRGRITLGARWVGARDDLDFRRPAGQRRVRRDPYARINLAAEYGRGRVVLTGRAENLFDDRAEELPGFRVRGRTLLLGLRLTVD